MTHFESDGFEGLAEAHFMRNLIDDDIVPAQEYNHGAPDLQALRDYVEEETAKKKQDSTRAWVPVTIRYRWLIKQALDLWGTQNWSYHPGYEFRVYVYPGTIDAFNAIRREEHHKRVLFAQAVIEDYDYGNLDRFHCWLWRERTDNNISLRVL